MSEAPVYAGNVPFRPQVVQRYDGRFRIVRRRLAHAQNPRYLNALEAPEIGRFVSPRVPAIFHAAILALAVSGCTTATTDTACISFGPITFSASGDTPETIRQVRSHNAAWEATCGK